MTRRVAVLGSPVAHSLSPVLHRAGYAALGWRDWRYDAIDCAADALPGLVRGSGPEQVGYSVTMPGKAAAAALADRVGERVRLLGVANTLLREPGGWRAENTDVDGVSGALAAAGVPPAERVLILGGGHTARAVLLAAADAGTRVVVLAGRRPASTVAGAELARSLGLRVREIDLSAAAVAAAANGAGWVAATLPAGVADPLAAALAAVPALLDVVYHPWPTALAAAGRPGRVTVTGLDMLLHQAFGQFTLFTGQPAPRVAMRDGLRAAVGVDLPLPVGS